MNTAQNDPQGNGNSLMKRKFILPVIILIGILVAISMVKSRKPLERQPETSLIKTATYIEVDKQNVSPSIIGFGEVEPDVLLESKAEVSGKIIYIHPELRRGSLLPAGTEVIRIDDKDYQLALKQAEANLIVSKANLKEMNLKLEDTRGDLSLAKQKLTIAEREEARQLKLLKRGSLSQSAFDSQKTVVLQLQQEVQNLTNQLDILPAQLEVLEAQVEISKASMATQKNNLDRTRITLPFNTRIESKSVEVDQFVSQGAILFSAQSIDKVQINAQFPLEQFRLLAKGFNINSRVFEESLADGDSKKLFSALGLKATVRIAGNTSGDVATEWEGEVERISGNLDPSAKTLGVTVSVKDPYKKVVPGVKPPLIQGLYTEVKLQGQPRPYYVVPRDAVHETELYLINDQEKLERINIKAHLQGPMVLLEQGLKDGNRVITSDVFPAVVGMKLNAVKDENKSSQIQQWLEAHQ